MSTPRNETKTYSVRERIAFAVAGVVIFLPTGWLIALMLITIPDMRTVPVFLAAAGCLGGLAVCTKIAATGSSSKFLERSPF